MYNPFIELVEQIASLSTEDTYNTNLETVWDIALSHEEFDDYDLFVILEAYFGEEVANKLLTPNTIPPCYSMLPCSNCKYDNYCLNKNRKKDKNDGEEIKESISRLFSDFKSRKLQ